MIGNLAKLGLSLVVASVLILAGILIACTSILYDCATYGNATLPGKVKITCEVIKDER